jgi:hypothetical protein
MNVNLHINLTIPLEPHEHAALVRAAKGRPLDTTLAAMALMGLDEFIQLQREKDNAWSAVECLAHDPATGVDEPVAANKEERP